MLQLWPKFTSPVPFPKQFQICNSLTVRATVNTRSGARCLSRGRIFANVYGFLWFIDNIMEITNSALTIKVVSVFQLIGRIIAKRLSEKRWFNPLSLTRKGFKASEKLA